MRIRPAIMVIACVFPATVAAETHTMPGFGLSDSMPAIGPVLPGNVMPAKHAPALLPFGGAGAPRFFPLNKVTFRSSGQAVRPPTMDAITPGGVVHSAQMHPHAALKTPHVPSMAPVAAPAQEPQDALQVKTFRDIFDAE